MHNNLLKLWLSDPFTRLYQRKLVGIQKDLLETFKNMSHIDESNLGAVASIQARIQVLDQLLDESYLSELLKEEVREDEVETTKK